MKATDQASNVLTTQKPNSVFAFERLYFKMLHVQFIDEDDRLIAADSIAVRLMNSCTAVDIDVLEEEFAQTLRGLGWEAAVPRSAGRATAVLGERVPSRLHTRGRIALAEVVQAVKKDFDKIKISIRQQKRLRK